MFEFSKAVDVTVTSDGPITLNKSYLLVRAAIHKDSFIISLIIIL